MRLLVGNWRFHGVGGSENYAIALAEELERQGHEVDTMTATDGHMVNGEYDAVFLSHNATVARFFEIMPDYDHSKVIQTIHGLTPQLEKPYTEKPIRYVAISEEIQAVYPTAKVIHQGIDLNLFYNVRELPEKPKTLFSLSQSQEFNALLCQICKDQGLEFDYRDKNENPDTDIHLNLQSADIVVSIGRGVYEAMACGREVIIADWRWYNGKLADGVIWSEGSFRHSMTCNCSGRACNYTATKEFIEESIRQYSQEAGVFNRQLVEKYNDIRNVATEYIGMVK